MSLKFSNKTTKIVILFLVGIVIASLAFLVFSGSLWVTAIWNYSSAGQRGDFTAAVAFAKQSVDIAEIYGDKHNPFLFYSLQRLGTVYEARRKFDTALAAYNKQLLIVNVSEGTDSTAAAAALVNVGRIYKKEHRFAEAEPLLRRAVTIYKTNHQKSDQALAEALDFLAWTIGNQGRYDEAFALYQQELALTEKLYGKDNILNATPIVGLGWVLEKKGSFKNALPFLDSAYELAIAHKGQDSAWLTVALTTLANIFRDHKEYEKAGSIYRLSLSMTDATLFMKDNLFKADMMESYAKLLRYKGQEPEAIALEMTAKKIRQGTF